MSVYKNRSLIGKGALLLVVVLGLVVGLGAVVHYGSHIILPNSYSPWYHMPLPSFKAHELVITVESQGKTYKARRIVREHGFVGLSSYGPLPDAFSINTVVVPLEGKSALIVDFNPYLRGSDLKTTGSRCFYVDDLNSPKTIKEFVYVSGLRESAEVGISEMNISFAPYYGPEEFSKVNEVKYDLTSLVQYAPAGAFDRYYEALGRTDSGFPEQYRLFGALVGTAIERGKSGKFPMVKYGLLPKFNDEKGTTDDLYMGSYYDEGEVLENRDGILEGYDTSYFDLISGMSFYNLCLQRNPSDSIKPFSFSYDGNQWGVGARSSCLLQYYFMKSATKDERYQMVNDIKLYDKHLSAVGGAEEVILIGNSLYQYGDVKGKFVYSKKDDTVFYVDRFRYLEAPVFSVVNQ